MAMVLVHEGRVSSSKWFSIWILKKTININIRKKVVNVKYFRSKLDLDLNLDLI